MTEETLRRYRKLLEAEPGLSGHGAAVLVLAQEVRLLRGVLYSGERKSWVSAAELGAGGTRVLDQGKPLPMHDGGPTGDRQCPHCGADPGDPHSSSCLRHGPYPVDYRSDRALHAHQGEGDLCRGCGEHRNWHPS